MKKMVCAILAAALLCGIALADVKTTANVNLRQGPGKEFGIITTVEAGTVMNDLDCIIADDLGADWYWVEYKGEKCWISSKYARFIESVDKIALEGYYGEDIERVAGELNLSNHESTGGELENSYYDDDLTILGNAAVECIVISGDQYSLFGAARGMMWYEALDACVQQGLYVIGAHEEHIVLEREAQYPGGMKSCINLILDGGGAVTGIDWSTYTSD